MSRRSSPSSLRMAVDPVLEWIYAERANVDIPDWKAVDIRSVAAIGSLADTAAFERCVLRRSRFRSCNQTTLLSRPEFSFLPRHLKTRDCRHRGSKEDRLSGHR